MSVADREQGRAAAPGLLRHLCYNIGGQALPLLLAAVSVPLLVRDTGVDRFGLLTIAWMVVGYFSLFDLGLGRAMTRVVAERLGRGRAGEVAQVVATGLLMMSVLGVLGGLLLALASPWLVALLHVPAPLRAETANAFVLLGLSVPAVVLATGLRGVLEAHHRFGVTNAIRTPLGLWTFGGPLCVLPFTARLDWIVATLVLGRYLAVLVYGGFTLAEVGRAVLRLRPERTVWRELLAFGGWMTVSNVVSPLMVYMDRFFIGAMLGTSAVAFYTSPYEVVFKLNIISEGLFGVLFPLMVRRFAVDRGASDAMFGLGVKLIAAGVFVPVLAIVALAEPFLGAWLGAEFAERSGRVMQLLALGLLVNGFSKVAFNLVQAHGRADVTARLHLLELPFYAVLLVALTRAWGIEGAAAAWTLRMLLDAALLWWMGRRVAGVSWRGLGTGAALALAACGLAGLPMLLGEASLRIALAALLLPVALAGFWRGCLGRDERALVKGLLRRGFAPRRGA